MHGLTSTERLFCNVVGFLVFTTSIARAQSFVDDFTNPYPTAPGRDPVTWEHLNGNQPVIEDESLIIGAEGTYGAAVVSGFSSHDVAIESQFRLEQGTHADLVFRFTPARPEGGSVDCYLAHTAASTHWNKLQAGIAQCSSGAFIGPSANVEFDALETELGIRVEVVGDHGKLWVWPADGMRPDQPLVSTGGLGLIGSGIGVVVDDESANRGVSRASFRFFEVQTLLPEDFNKDFTVDFGDFLAFADGYGMAATGAFEVYDLDGSGTIDFPDFLQFANAFNTEASTAPTSIQVPEPATATATNLALLTGAVLFVAGRRRLPCVRS